MQASSTPTPPALPSGAELSGGQYRIEALLGHARFGTVYRALSIAHGRPVALKLLSPDLVADAPGAARFRREADLARRLTHPNIVRILDFGQVADGTPYITFELVRGRSLASLLAATGPLPMARAIRIGGQVLKALMDAHTQGIVHRDVTPSNILVGDHAGEADFVRVLDFGIAKMDGDVNGLTRTGQVLGTPAYMAPEALVGAQTSAATDLYSVGLVLAEMLAGAPVFRDESAIQICVAHGSAAAMPLPQRVLASPLGAVVERATRKEPRDRYASAAEMLADLEAPIRSMRAPPIAAPPTAQLGATFVHEVGGYARALAFAGLGGRGAGVQAAWPSPPCPQVAAPARSSATLFAGLGALAVVAACAVGVAHAFVSRESADPSATPFPAVVSPAPQSLLLTPQETEPSAEASGGDGAAVAGSSPPAGARDPIASGAAVRGQGGEPGLDQGAAASRLQAAVDGAPRPVTVTPDSAVAAASNPCVQGAVSKIPIPPIRDDRYQASGWTVPAPPMGGLPAVRRQ